MTDSPSVHKYSLWQITTLRFMTIVLIALWHILGKLRFNNDEYVTIRQELDSMAKEFTQEIHNETIQN
jgi:hypothetical protein